MSRKNKNKFLEEDLSATKDVTSKINDLSTEIPEDDLTEFAQDNENITLVDNYSEAYENLSSFNMNKTETKSNNNSKKFKKPNLKLKKPTLKRWPVYLLTSATSNIKKTADSIRMVANSVDGIVSSLELLAPVIGSLSKETVHSNVNKNNVVTSTPDEQNFPRNMDDLNQLTKSSQNQANFAQFLENPLVQNMLKNLANNQK